MKVLWLVPVLLISACGKMKQNKKSDFSHEVRTFAPVVPNTNTQIAISRLCIALAAKNSNLQDDRSTQRIFPYQVDRQTNCEVRTASMPIAVPVTVIGSGGMYSFQPQTAGSVFPFPEIETNTYGLWQNLCVNTPTMRLPFHTSTNGASAAWITLLGEATNGCKTDANNLCFMVERGTVIQGEQYEIMTREVVNYQINGSNVGHFTYRSLQTFSGCERGSRSALAFFK